MLSWHFNYLIGFLEPGHGSTSSSWPWIRYPHLSHTHGSVGSICSSRWRSQPGWTILAWTTGAQSASLLAHFRATGRIEQSLSHTVQRPRATLPQCLHAAQDERRDAQGLLKADFEVTDVHRVTESELGRVGDTDLQPARGEF